MGNDEKNNIPADENAVKIDTEAMTDEMLLNNIIEDHSEGISEKIEKEIQEVKQEKEFEEDDLLNQLIDPDKTEPEREEDEEEERYEPYPNDDRYDDDDEYDDDEYYEDESFEEYDEADVFVEKKKKKSKAGVLVVILLLLLVLGVVGFLFFRNSLPEGFLGTPTTEEETAEDNRVLMPNVVGMSLKEAKETIAPFQLALKLEYEASKEPLDSILKQSIEEGSEIQDGMTVTLTVAQSMEKAILNDYVGGLENPVANGLRSKGYDVKIIEQELDGDDVKVGEILKTEPEAGAIVQAGDTITLYVSRERQTVSTTVPNVTGLTENEAIIMLREANLNVLTKYEPNNMFYGRVVWQTIPSGTVIEEGTEITITIGTEEAPTTAAPQVIYVQDPNYNPNYYVTPETQPAVQLATVPSLYGMEISQAVAMAEQSGLYVNVLYTPDEANIGYVIGQDIAAGTVVEYGTMITITIGE